MKLSRPKLNPVSSLLRGGKTNLLIALVMAVGMIAALSIFASGGQLVHPNCPEPVTKWAYNLGWKNPDTFTCKPDMSKHSHDALPGSVAEAEFKKINNTKDLKQFINSNSDIAGQFRQSAKQAMDANSYKAWLSGDNFVMVQFKKPAVIKGNSYLAGGKIEYNDSHLRPVKSGDILFVFVDPTKKQASLQDEATDAIAGLVPQEANAATKKYSPLKVNINPNLNVEIKVSGDCKGDNTRRTGADGSITFPNCDTGNHTVTVDNQVSKDGKTYKVNDNSKQVNVPNQGSGNVTFTYNQLSTGGNGGGGNGGGGNGGGNGGATDARGNVKVNINPNINVQVKIDGDCKGDNTRNTGADGNITFQNCAAGKHTVSVQKTVKQGGQSYKVTDNAKSVTVKKGGTETVEFKYGKDDTVGGELTGVVNPAGNIRLDCGNVRVIQIFPKEKQVIGHLKIVKFEDKNGNGKEDKGEPRMKGVKFYIKGVGDFTTDKNGEVEIKNLDPDSYNVKEIQNKQTEGYRPSTKDEQKAKVVENKTEVVKFGNKPVTGGGNIKIVKFEDRNGNGKQDAGEPRMKGVEFKIEGYGVKKTNKDGVINVKDIPLGKKVEVKERLASLNGGKKDQGKDDGKNDGKKDDKAKASDASAALLSDDSDADFIDPATGQEYEATETESDATDVTEASKSKVEDKTNDATYRPTTPTTQTAVSATPVKPIYFGNQTIIIQKEAGALLIGKIVDTNGNGQVDEGEQPQGGVNFTVTGPNNFNQVITTNEAGFAAIGGLEPGEYTIVEQVPAGYVVSGLNPQVVTVTANQISGAGFFNQPEQETGGLLIGKAIDTNGNGQVETGDLPQADVTFTVTGPNDFKQTVKTSKEGFAGLGGLVPGEYTIEEQVPANFKVVSTNPQKVTVIAKQVVGAPFLNQYICTPSPSPQVSPAPSPTPAPTCAPTPTPTPTPGGSITEAFGNLPKTGQAGLILLASFLTAAGLYYGNKYRHAHQSK